MTTIYKQIQQTITKSEFVSCHCDWCNKEMEEDYGNRSYNTREFELKFSSGISYGSDGGDESGWRVNDLCDECVIKLKKLLVENGIKISEIDVSW